MDIAKNIVGKIIGKPRTLGPKAKDYVKTSDKKREELVGM